MNIIITGASSGIGFETSLKYAAESQNQVVALSRSEAGLNKLAGKASAGNIQPMVFDITSHNFSGLDEHLNKIGMDHVDILIHNAGALVNKPFESTTYEDWKQVYEVNILGVAMLTQFLLSRMGMLRTSHIVMISSIGGVTGSVKFPGLTVYSSSKGALSVFAEVLATELYEKNIRVNCLALGSVQTPMLEKAFPGYEAAIGPEVISDFICDFGTGGWRYFNGKVIPVSIGNP